MPAARRGTSRPIRTLVVDDNKEYRAHLIDYLRAQEDIEIVGEAGDGETAVNLALSLDPDLILMDIQMPGVDGAEATRRLRKRQVRAKIVFITIHDKDSYRDLAEFLMVDGFVGKNSVRHDLPGILQKIKSE